MNNKQTNKLASFTATEAVLQATPEIASVPGLPELLAVFSAKVGEINRLAKTQTQPIQPRTAERDGILDAMTDMTLQIAGYVRSVARETGTPQLAQDVRVGVASFRRARRSHRVWFAQRVLDAARGVLPQLGAYGVTAETLVTLEARIQAATQRVNLPRETVGAKRAATRRMAELFVEVEALLDDGIDALVYPLRLRHPEFHATYEAARLVVNRPGGRKADDTVAPPVPAAATELRVAHVSDQRAA